MSAGRDKSCKTMVIICVIVVVWVVTLSIVLMIRDGDNGTDRIGAVQFISDPGGRIGKQARNGLVVTAGLDWCFEEGKV